MTTIEQTSTGATGSTAAGTGGFGAAMRAPGVLVAAYLAVSAAAVGAIAVLRDHADLVNQAVWSRGIAVLISAAICALVVRGAARGKRSSFLRLRLVSAISVVAVAVIVAVPGDFPVWLKAEQAVCGVLLAAVVALVNRPAVRALYRKA
jgi:uncharacterized membrane protein